MPFPAAALAGYVYPVKPILMGCEQKKERERRKHGKGEENDEERQKGEKWRKRAHRGLVDGRGAREGEEDVPLR